jgi:hypothetical protein
MKAYLTVLALLVPVFLTASAASAHSSLSDNVSHFHDLNYFLEGSTNLIGLTMLGAVVVAVLVHLNINKKRVETRGL